MLVEDVGPWVLGKTLQLIRRQYRYHSTLSVQQCEGTQATKQKRAQKGKSMWKHWPPACEMKQCGNRIQVTKLKSYMTPWSLWQDLWKEKAKWLDTPGSTFKDRGIRMGTTAFSAQESCTFWKAACLSQVLILYSSQLCITTVLTSLYSSTPSPALLHLTRLWILRSETISSKTLSAFPARMTSLHWEFYEVAMIYVCEYAWVWTSIVVYICVCWGQELIIDVLPYGQPHLPLWDRTSQVW